MFYVRAPDNNYTTIPIKKYSDIRFKKKRTLYKNLLKIYGQK